MDVRQTMPGEDAFVPHGPHSAPGACQYDRIQPGMGNSMASSKERYSIEHSQCGVGAKQRVQSGFRLSHPGACWASAMKSRFPPGSPRAPKLQCFSGHTGPEQPMDSQPNQGILDPNIYLVSCVFLLQAGGGNVSVYSKRLADAEAEGEGPFVHIRVTAAEKRRKSVYSLTQENKSCCFTLTSKPGVLQPVEDTIRQDLGLGPNATIFPR
ncbi:hypothetical protein H920_12762 [Fukomys damarensis]|uniref:Uncharacterized protein n=1 Tax=Fukomys damarensis TaxID=885580 RepID=A0A091D159_FUKDA|nr:hypothetical protein H920_12762 [Fukomys damarensis]